MRSSWIVTLVGIETMALFSLAGGPSGETGSVTGQVRVRGASGPSSLHVTKDTEVCGTQLPSEAAVVGPGGGLRNAVVSIEGVARAPAATPRDLSLRNERCAFRPHVQAGMVGSRLTLSNLDPVLHNVHLSLASEGRSRTLVNLALPGRIPRIDASRATRSPGIVKVKCDAHDWMSAYVLLFDHPLYAVTDDAGSFSIARVPPGTHVVRVWHETFGELTKTVRVEAGASTTVSFVLGG